MKLSAQPDDYDQRADLHSLNSVIGAPVEHPDLATVIKVPQAISSEIVLEKLIDALMRTALQQAGADRGALLLLKIDAILTSRLISTDPRYPSTSIATETC